MKRAFTLIELLIVVAIIGVLAAIAVPNFLNAMLRAKVSRVHADQKAVSTALEQYYLDWNTYVENHDYPDEISEIGFFRLTSPTPYLSSLPLDPFPSNSLRNYSEDNPHFEFGSGNITDYSITWPRQAYIMISAGPNLIEEVDGNTGFPHLVFIRSYDASNGLSSGGDIYRMGGQWSSGNIFVDGRWIAGGQ